MNSSWLLLNVFRRKIWVCLFIEFVIVLLVALNDINPSRRESIWVSVNVAYLLAVGLSFLLWFQTGCNRLPFPVSIRQRAWLPMVAFGMIWAAGGLALLLAVLWLSTWPRELISVIPSVVGRIPLYLLGFMIMFRILSTKPYLIGFVLWFFIPVHQDRATWYQACVSTYNLWWPLALAAIAYYVWEAPTQLAQQDRLLVGQSAGRSPFPQRDMSISPRRAPLSWMGDVIECGLFLAGCLLCVRFFLIMFMPDSLGDPLSFVKLILPAIMAFSLVMIVKSV
ncbi:MAG: hypothetical protein IIC50_03520 [Planctomycetes bacterium]|nr:hypothetical protein [Planctomycetota bacterium]